MYHRTDIDWVYYLIIFVAFVVMVVLAFNYILPDLAAALLNLLALS